MYGYETMTTFWEDFSIADRFGISAIEDTYVRAFGEWRFNYRYLTELVLVLNWKIWQHHEKNDDFAKLYNELWLKTDEYANSTLQGKELEYFFRITD